MLKNKINDMSKRMVPLGDLGIYRNLFAINYKYKGNGNKYKGNGFKGSTKRHVEFEDLCDLCEVCFICNFN
jgi:hypothetical protein